MPFSSVLSTANLRELFPPGQTIEYWQKRFESRWNGAQERRRIRFLSTEADSQPQSTEGVGHEWVPLHILCPACRKTFGRSKLVRGSWLSLIEGSERFELHASRCGFEGAVKSHCHFCTLLHQYMVLWEDFMSSTVPPDSPINIVITHVSARLLQVELNVSGITRVPDADGIINDDFEYNFYVEPGLSQIHGLPHQSQNFLSTASACHMQLARQWLDDCTKNHFCGDEQSSTFVPTRLIYVGLQGDSSSHRLYLPSEHDHGIRYCTLSHCWGDLTKILTTTTANLASFIENIPTGQLPQNFQDAIAVTRGLGVSYLWVDSLCILQDSEKDWIEQSALMGQIYESSICTIASAAASDSSQSCFITRNPLEIFPCRIYGQLNDGLFAHYKKFNTLHEDLRRSRFMSRAWVVQERMLSPRVLYFGPTGLVWSCTQGLATENWPIPQEFPDNLFRSGPSYANSGLRNRTLIKELMSLGTHPLDPAARDSFHERWSNLILEYTSCQLTKSHDKLIALSGIAQRVQQGTGYTYLAGLWKETFPRDLLWQLHRPGQLGRALSDLKRLDHYRAPTWSWASVEHAVSVHDSGKRSEDWGLLIEVRGAQIDTHNADKSKCGQVIYGSVIVWGRLKEVPWPAAPWPTPVLEDIWGYVLQDGDNAHVGNLYLDIIPHEPPLDRRLYLLPIIDKKPALPSGLGWFINGIALISNGSFYERVGLVVLQNANWMREGEGQEIEIR